MFGISLTITVETTTKSTLSFPEVPALFFGEIGLFGMFGGLVGSSWSVPLVGMSTSLDLLGESARGGIN